MRAAVFGTAVNCTPKPNERLRLDFTVTADHIAQGRPGSCTLCPVTLAIEDHCRARGIALWSQEPIKVFGADLRLLLADGRYFYSDRNEEVRQFVLAIDDGAWEYIFPRSLTVTFIESWRRPGER